ncbi:glycosyl hydrolase family 16 [uncultured Polaribacter sp.]|uniref:glycosyl hydrolase family 16 n=1 Tax=uncultured Polaribacter sp. TaxID=174711 RepID=UPI002618505C|nr:glycosyl hydrolase family 16 [uncultured Polaribacter sp.]
MKIIQFIDSKIIFVLGLFLITFTSCERHLSDEAEFATHATTAEIFIDGFEGGLDYFPFGGSFLEAFSVDTDESYTGEASMRFDIPSFGVGFGGATFPSTAPRDLSGYDALTFWAKASKGADINEIGFGIDGNGSKYQVTASNLAISTKWTKYIVPIPDPKKLIEHIGMFWYAEGAENENDEGGYSFWIDDLQFEKLGTIAQPRPAILNGEEITEQAFNGGTVNLADRGLTQTFNLGSGANQTVSVAPSYFTFNSTDVDVARVSELGVVSIVGNGTATITATLNGVKALGSLTIETIGSFDFAPTPTLASSSVISIFSDAYTNIPVDFFNGFWEPFQTTLSADFTLNNNNILGYTNFNFVGHQFSSPTVDATEKSTLHINMYIPAEIPADLDFLITIKDFGPDKADGGGDDTTQQVFFYAEDFEAYTWATLEIPITMVNKNNIGQIIYENINNPTTSSIESFYLDNIYFHN